MVSDSIDILIAEKHCWRFQRQLRECMETLGTLRVPVYPTPLTRNLSDELNGELYLFLLQKLSVITLKCY